MHVIRHFKSHGLQKKILFIVCDVLIISKIRHALEVWGNFLSKTMINCLDKFLR